MNCILKLDSTTTEDLVIRTMRTRSHEDVLALAAMDWILRYRFVRASDELLRLASPGFSTRVRYGALNILAQPAFDARTSLFVLLQAQIREASPDARCSPRRFLLALFPERGLPLVEEQGERETK